jgi:hypothetical protein
MYFNEANSIEIIGFYIHSSYSFMLWAKPELGDSSILSYEYLLWQGWDEWNRIGEAGERF